MSCRRSRPVGTARAFRWLAAPLLAWALLLSPPVSAQTTQEAVTAQAPVLGPAELDPLLAPVALYPDTLLMQVLAAATYPLEVVEAERFVRANPRLKGEALTQAAGSRDWDPSVVALLQFPSVLAMMSEKLDWTQQLGDAFLAQQSDVMDTVQALRQRAVSAGNLADTQQQRVMTQERVIVIEPARPQVIYVPYYNPTIVYGSWWHPRPPWVWVPPPYYRPANMGDVIAAGIFWGLAVAITNSIWNDYRPDWREHHIHVHHHVHVHPSRPRPLPGALWRHDPVHRKGVAYRHPAVRDKVVGMSRPAPRPITPGVRPGRGDDPQLQPRPAVLPARDPARPAVTRPSVDRPTARPSPPGVTRPAPEPRPAITRPAPRPEVSRPVPMPRPAVVERPAPRPSPLQPGAGRDQVRTQAERGRQSREAMQPTARPAPARPTAARPAPPVQRTPPATPPAR
jgi:hypothetical protein